MTEDSSQASEPQAEPGVFGNLPRTRPGARSPRRDAAAAKAEASGTRPAPRQADEADRRAAAGPPPPVDQPAEQAPAGEEEGGGLEELAWAGVAAAAEAATLGVRLANRALESLRGDSERS